MKRILAVVGVLVALLGAYVLAHWALIEAGGEVIVLRTEQPGGGWHETRLWIVDEGETWWLHGNPGSQWMQNLAARPIVEVVRAGTPHRLRAVPVPGPHPRIDALLREKYGLADRWVRLVGPDGPSTTVVRLDPIAEAAGPEWEARGAAVARELKGRLLRELTAALADGPEHAIDVCRVRAPAIAAELGSEAVAAGRTSHRLRNPANAPRAWVAPLLAEAATQGRAATARAVRLPSGGVGYVEPLFVAPLCLACHGESLAPPVAERIRAGYPDDEATGFREGDFRGLVWVEFASGPGASR